MWWRSRKLAAHCAQPGQNKIAAAAATTTDAVGRGELSAALSSLQSLVAIGSPLLWGSIFRFVQSTGKNTWWYNPGGGFLLAALGRFGIRQAMAFVCERYAEDLVINDE